MNRKSIAAVLLSASILFTAGCSGSSDNSAKSLYKSYVNHYGYVADSFGEDFSKQTFEEYTADLDDCTPIDGESMAMMTMLIGSTLTSHGDDVATFVKDTNKLLAAVQAEGLCGSAAPAPAAEAPTTTTTEPYVAPTTTTTEPNLYGSAAADICYGEAWDNLKELSDGVVNLAELAGPSITADQRKTLNDGLAAMQDTITKCTGLVSDGFLSAEKDLLTATKELVRLHTTP